MNEKLNGRGKRSEMTSKANCFQKFKRWLSRKQINGIEAQYMDELNNMCSLAVEQRIKRLVAYMLPGWHLHRNPTDTGVKRNPFPSGNDL